MGRTAIKQKFLQFMVSIYELAFSKIYGVGFRVGNEILKHLTPEELFTSSRTSLEALFGGRTRTINDILNKTMFAQCERELDFIIKTMFAPHSLHTKIIQLG